MFFLSALLARGHLRAFLDELEVNSGDRGCEGALCCGPLPPPPVRQVRRDRPMKIYIYIKIHEWNILNSHSLGLYSWGGQLGGQILKSNRWSLPFPAVPSDFPPW